MDPVTLALIAGTGLSMFGQYQAGQQSAAALNAEADQAQLNAASAKLMAQSEAEQYSIQARKAIGGIQAQYSGAGLSGGSAFAVLADSKINAELDRLSIIFGGNLRSTQFQSESAGKRAAAGNAKSAGMLGVLTSGFMGGAKIAGS